MKQDLQYTCCTFWENKMLKIIKQIVIVFSLKMVDRGEIIY